MEPAALTYPPVPQGPPETILGRVLQWFVRPRTSAENLPKAAYPTSGAIAIAGQQVGLATITNAASYRAWSLTPWVRAAIDIRRDQLASADWDIVTIDPSGPKNVRLRKQIRDLLETPNAKQVSFQQFVEESVDDLLTLDGAAIEKVRYPNGDIAELWPTPSDFIHVSVRWDGSDPEAPRYYWVPDGTIRATFKNSDMLYMMANARTISPVGVSPIHILRTVIDSELQAMEYNRRQVMGAVPFGALNIGDTALPEDVQKARSFWEANVLGQGAMAIIGGYKSPTWMPFNTSNQEMQYREWVDLLLRCIAVVYGLSPMDLGITFDVNRSTAEAQGANTEDRGLRPLMSLVQGYFTREIVWDKAFGGRENNLAFRWTALNLNETKQKADINKVAMPGVGWKSINEARIMDGRDPIEDPGDDTNIFNHVLIGTPKGILDLNTEKYLGEDQLLDLKKDLAAHQGEIDAEASAQDAKEAQDFEKSKPKPEPKPAGVVK